MIYLNSFLVISSVLHAQNKIRLSSWPFRESVIVVMFRYHFSSAKFPLSSSRIRDTRPGTCAKRVIIMTLMDLGASGRVLPLMPLPYAVIPMRTLRNQKVMYYYVFGHCSPASPNPFVKLLLL